MAGFSDGSFVVTWQSYNQTGDNSNEGIYGQRFNTDGSKLGSEFQVNTYTSSHQRYPDVAVLKDGSYVITWDSYNQDGSNEGIYGQRFDANGNVDGSEFRINTYTSSHQNNPTITALEDGGFVVAWQNSSGYSGGSGWDIQAQMYDASGNP